MKQYYLSYRPRTECGYFTIFQDKLHSVNIQDDQSWALSETVQKFPKSPIRPAGSRFYSASCQCGRVFEWTLMELRFNIIANLLLLFFCYLMISVITMCNLIKRLIRTTSLSTPASDVHERWKQTPRTSDLKLQERLLAINKRNIIR